MTDRGSDWVTSAITDAVSLVHARYYGKGPREAKTYMEDGFVFCVLEDPFTTVEQTLIEVGSRADVRELRQRFQDALDHEFKQIVRELTGREVAAFMGQTHIAPDLAIEIFKLVMPEDDARLTSVDP